MSHQAFMQTAQALGSTVELRLITESGNVAQSLFKKLWEKIANFENAFSRFIASSELSGLNARAGESVKVSEEFRHLLTESLKFNTRTQGLFNPFVLPALQRAGYRSSLSSKENQKLADYQVRDVPEFSKLKISGSSVEIPKNSALDLGGIGKGFLADRLAEMTHKTTENFCLSLGGDMILSGADENGSSWRVEVQSVENRSQNAATVLCSEPSFSVATSGQVRNRNKKHQKHSIDPRTSKPSESNCLMATVVAEDALTADVLAGCCVIGGAQFAEKMFESSDVYGILLQFKDGSIKTLGECFGGVDA